HLWERVLWICDVAKLVQAHPALNWQQVTKQATAMGCERMLALGLVLANDLLGVVVANEQAQRLMRHRSVQALALEMAKRLFQMPHPPIREVERAAIYLRMRDRWFDRTRYSLLLSFSANLEKQDTSLLPRTVVFCYYLLQPVRLAVRHAWPSPE